MGKPVRRGRPQWPHTTKIQRITAKNKKLLKTFQSFESFSYTFLNLFFNVNVFSATLRILHKTLKFPKHKMIYHYFDVTSKPLLLSEFSSLSLWIAWNGSRCKFLQVNRDFLHNIFIIFKNVHPCCRILLKFFLEMQSTKDLKKFRQAFKTC